MSKNEMKKKKIDCIVYVSNEKRLMYQINFIIGLWSLSEFFEIKKKSNKTAL